MYIIPCSRTLYTQTNLILLRLKQAENIFIQRNARGNVL